MNGHNGGAHGVREMIVLYPLGNLKSEVIDVPGGQL